MGPEGYERKALGMGISPHWGSVGQTGVGSSTGDFSDMVERGSRGGVSLSLCGSSVKGTWRDGFLAGDPEGYVEKALETGISFHRGLIWGTWRRSHLPRTVRDE